MNLKPLKLLMLFTYLGYSALATAGSVKIGNSDDGRDLENLSPITSGPIFDAKLKALELIEKLNTAGIRGLGALKPELERAPLFLAKEDVKASIQDDYRPDHLSSEGKVYARTMPEPYAPVRFFPLSEKLSPDQLIKLHIHEALHHALPAEYRADESVVAQLTLAITSPDASHDQVSSVAQKIIKPEQEKKISYRKDLYPSLVSYSVRDFSGVDSGSSFDVTRAHVLKSYLYPFGTDDNTFGLGLDFSLISRNGSLQSGPVGFSFRWKAFTARGFDFDLYGGLSLNTLSFQEMKNSPYGRDVGEIGVSLRRELNHFYIENSLSLRNGGTSTQTVGLVDYEYRYGEIIEPSVHVGGVLGAFHFGGYLNFFLSDQFSIVGGSFAENKGRFRVVSIGPELNYKHDSLVVWAKARYLVDSTKDADLGTLGLLDKWVGRGGFELGVGYGF